jgi:hypothetical protein
VNQQTTQTAQTAAQAAPAKPRKHLMVPGQPRPAPARSMSLTSVQRWVMSTLMVSTGLHMAGGLVLAAHYVDVRSSAIGLLVISAAFGIVAMAAGLLIHRTPLRVAGGRLPHPLLLAGLLPALLGVWWIFA